MGALPFYGFEQIIPALADGSQKGGNFGPSIDLNAMDRKVQGFAL
jgi:hypothetical protein